MSGGTKETFQLFEEDDVEELEYIPNVPLAQWHNNHFMFQCEHRQNGNKCYCKLNRRWVVLLLGVLLVFLVYSILFFSLNTTR